MFCNEENAIIEENLFQCLRREMNDSLFFVLHEGSDPFPYELRYDDQIKVDDIVKKEQRTLTFRRLRTTLKADRRCLSTIRLLIFVIMILFDNSSFRC